MQVVVRSHAAAEAVDVDFELRNPDATLGDLFRAVSGTAPPEHVYVGSRRLPATCTVSDSGLHEGATLSVAAHESPPPADRGRHLVVTGGLNAGASVPVTAGVVTVGRAPQSDVVLDNPSVSRRHFELRVDSTGRVVIRDTASANGTTVDGTLVHDSELALDGAEAQLVAGAVTLAVRPLLKDRPRGLDVRRQVAATGTIPFNRPPRPGRPGAPSPLTAPDEPHAAQKPHFSVASFVGPLVLAGVMVASTGDMKFALFSALSPLLGVGTYLESRRRVSKSSGGARGEYERGLTVLRDELTKAAKLELERLRDVYPDPAEVLRRAAQPSMRLWERRPSQDRESDFMRLHMGVASQRWHAEVSGARGSVPGEVTRLLEASRLVGAPVSVDLAGGGVLGIVGDRRVALAVARSLACQAAVHHGPADLTIGVFVDPGRDQQWDWAKWLPHTRSLSGGGGERWLSSERGRSDALLRSIQVAARERSALVILDSDVLTEGKNAPGRAMLNSAVAARTASSSDRASGSLSAIVIAQTEDRLPAACNTVLELVGDEGDAIYRRPGEDVEIADVLVAGVSLESSRRCALDLARFEDPELEVVGAGLPDSVRLLPLLDLPAVDATSIRRRWQAGGLSPGAEAPLGVTEEGVFTVDLVRDGPHGLVGGTTGSGKSELLRTLVAGLAAHADPTKLTFVLVDYKGGAAFDVCGGLPHTVGLVTDLDEQLGRRALRALEAELHRRERMLRAAGVDNLRGYLETGAEEPLPRLVLVVDEFATMAKELPEFMSSLVSIAQRGRTLGVHMILATQRPAGVVKEDISANTNLKIALRMQAASDSVDVIGAPAAAGINRQRAGRAFVRLGPGELVPIQTALVTCRTSQGDDAPIAVRPFAFGVSASADSSSASGDAPTDLARLVDAIREANELEGFAPPRRPWPEPLPPRVELGTLDHRFATEVAVALADDPEHQSQYGVGWDLAEGNLLLIGNPGSGTTTTLSSIALGVASRWSPEEVEILVLDLGAGELGALEPLPHTASVVFGDDRERQVRLLRHLRADVDRRREAQRSGRSSKRCIVLIDNFGALRQEFDDIEGLELLDGLYRVFADGPEVRLSFAIAADRASALPTALTAVTTQKWLFRLADAYEYSSFGVDPRSAPHRIAGRAVVAATAQHVQVAVPTDSIADEVKRIAAQHPDRPDRVPLIRVLPTDVPLSSLNAVAALEGEPWRIPVGIRESDLEVAELVLYEGEHALIAGPARSGKSTALLTIATVLRNAAAIRGVPLQLYGMGGRRSPLAGSEALDRYAVEGDETGLLAAARVVKGPVVLLVDDAEAFDDSDSAISGLLSYRKQDLHVFAAARPDSLRTLYGHWTTAVRRSKAGLLLQPNIDLDGDLLGATLPRRAPVAMWAGRGYLVSTGAPDLIQTARISIP